MILCSPLLIDCEFRLLSVQNKKLTGGFSVAKIK